mmetsp:Transcript_78156/g.217037  ORF Transcript_78156/g.217037 Transcript_78156/m.217037 type:complete len:135 (+) Transcript_78156:132-536(+)
MVDASAWITTQLHAQRNFFHGLLCILLAVVLRWRGILSPEDSVPLAKLTFRIFMPALCFAKIWKAPLHAGMWRLAVAASVLSAIQFIIVKIIARFVHAKTQHRAFTGQESFFGGTDLSMFVATPAVRHRSEIVG